MLPALGIRPHSAHMYGACSLAACAGSLSATCTGFSFLLEVKLVGRTDASGKPPFEVLEGPFLSFQSIFHISLDIKKSTSLFKANFLQSEGQLLQCGTWNFL